jgi:hypothetical protein
MAADARASRRIYGVNEEGCMTSFRKALLFGILISVIAYLMPFIIWRKYLVPFEFVLLTVTAASFGVVYFRNVKQAPLKEGFRVGLLWLVVTLIVYFIDGSVSYYLLHPYRLFLDPDTGVLREPTLLDLVVHDLVKYLVIPVVPIGFGALLELRKRGRSTDNKNRVTSGSA